MQIYLTVIWDITGSRFDGPYEDRETAEDHARDAVLEGGGDLFAGVIGPLDMARVERSNANLTE